MEVVAHEAVPARFDRYRMTRGYNGIINQRQFRLGAPLFPEDFRYPDRTYRDSTTIEVGDLSVQLHHDKGETDDHTWVWIPHHRASLHGRPLHLGRAQLRQPAEGPALPDRVGGRSPQDAVPGRRDPASRSRPTDPRGEARLAGAGRHRRAARNR
ncbi:MAG: hypothetical protein M5U19_16935 [Microthrixaceae bacterium]|nr:hypothetical protein [Microthrixaceae bacterium]